MATTHNTDLYSQMKRLPKGILALLGMSLVLSLSLSSQAAHTEKVGHSTIRVYRTALRYLRINKRFKVTEKDEVSGYLLFEYPGEKGAKSSRGSIEVVDTESGSLLIVRIENYPRYYEEYLAAGVMTKLKDQYGASEPKKIKKTISENKPAGDKEDDKSGPEKKDQQKSP